MYMILRPLETMNALYINAKQRGYHAWFVDTLEEAYEYKKDYPGCRIMKMNGLEEIKNITAEYKVES